MARNTQDRENLLRDATAFDRRISFIVELEGQKVEVFAGFRPQGSLSIYFGADPVYQFNSKGELRRAFYDGRLIKAELGQLYAWHQERIESNLELIPHAIHVVEKREFCKRLQITLNTLHNAVVHEQFSMVGQFPESVELMSDLCHWLNNYTEVSIADTPNVC